MSVLNEIMEYKEGQTLDDAIFNEKLNKYRFTSKVTVGENQESIILNLFILELTRD